MTGNHLFVREVSILIRPLCNLPDIRLSAICGCKRGNTVSASVIDVCLCVKSIPCRYCQGNVSAIDLHVINSGIRLPLCNCTGIDAGVSADLFVA